MNFKIFLVFCITICAVFAADIPQCSIVNRAKLDQYLMEIFTFGDPNGKFASNSQEFALTCSNTQKLVDWVTDYVDKCTYGVIKTLLSTTLKQLAGVLKNVCVQTHLTKQHITFGECGSKAHNLTIKCWQDYVLDLEKINSEKERISDADKVELICCDNYKFNHCYLNALHSKGTDICPETVKNGIQSHLSEIGSKATKLLCGDFSSYGFKCDAVREKYTNLKTIVLANSGELRKSPLTAYIDILSGTGIELKSIVE
jgi:hypothetical protein